ncbi:dTDP-4-dehydrorhamnose 3,5-epimerase family protein [Roseateles sp.]|uniref:dTDP-4-dehydrorhamnose 3,5-epimerase family protein n=1 Tax=Roseateles sp. TaxID=1971397 RepID=UPI0032660E3A
MEFLQPLLSGVRVVLLDRFDDDRGSFVKTYSRSAFGDNGLEFDFREEFYSFSKKGVIRGMHFQTPPHHHDKIVYCAAGAVLDVLLDLRPGADYGRAASIVLEAARPHLIFIPSGVAHGFKSLEEHSLMIYKTSTQHAPSHDAGVKWDSFGFDWGINSPTISKRDVSHPSFFEYQSAF